jgi:acyl-CoA synthetase (AMP-forming)/AMP-acid ligase II
VAPSWVGDIPATWAGADGGRVALVDASGSHTWRDLDDARRAWAERLAALGVRAGDRVMVVGENAPAMAMLIFAVTTLRAWIVNTNARLSTREVEAIRGHARPRRVIYLTGISPDARAHAAADAGASDVDGGRWGAMALSALDEAASAEPVEGDPARDVAALLYTTGTTGDPKAVMLTHSNLLFVARSARELRAITPGDRVLALLPLTHVYGLASVCLGSLLGGASLHFQARFAPAAAAAFIREQRLTVCQGVPAMYAKLLQHLRAVGETAFELPTLRFLYAGGSPLALDLKRDVEAFFGLTLHNGYGLTEASPTLTQTRHGAPRDDCSVGPALPGVELRSVDARGGDLPDGEVGELWARGPNVMKGYYRDPVSTAATMRPGGWLATGDLARREPDGACFIEGRLKELIIRSGFNVFPVEVEAVLNAHPAVSQSAVVGRAVAGDEEVVAFVELAPGKQASVEALLAHCAAALAAYKRPSQLVIVPALPAAASGKVLKGKLAQMARELSPAR